nr:MAG TPA: minor tail protein [Caudoviricetes sp.]
MANNIKGITIQIGGDTTKLDKALAGTNKQIKTTQSELKAVEKALKLDPGNTTLLAQKQRLLADGVGQTAEKLKTLKQAAETADEALARGKNYEAKYEPLQAKVEETTKSLQALVAQQGDMEAGLASGKISGEAYDNYNQAVAATKQQLADLLQQQKAVEEEFSGAKLNQRQYDALQREIVETESDLKDLTKQSKEAESSLKKIGDTAGTVADKTQGISTVAAGVLAGVVATVPATEELRDTMAVLATNAQEAGVGLGTAESALKTFNAASNELDSSLEATSNLLQAGFTESNLQKAVENLTGAYLRFPDTLKVESLADSLQETLATGTATGQFGELLDRLGIGAENFSAGLSSIATEADRQNYALDTLSKAGLAETYAAWQKNNSAIVESRDASYEMQQSMARLAETIQPLVTDVVEFATKLLDFFTSLPAPAQKSILAVLTFTAGISPIARLVSNITGAIQGVSAVSKVFNATAGNSVYLTFAKWALIIMGVVAVMTALLAVIAALTGKGKDVERTMNSIGSAVSGVGNVNKSGGAAMHSMADLGAPAVVDSGTVPYLAQGGVARANNPFLAVVGDNRREDEVIAPETVIKQWTVQGIQESGLLSAARESGSRTGGSATMQLDGRTFARLIYPYLQAEARRMGTTVKL